MITIGIDPGLSGALAILGEDGMPRNVLDFEPIVIRDRSLAWINGAELQSFILGELAGRPARVYVERVGAMPKQGVSSMFTFGMTVGSVLSVIQSLQLPIEMVTPAVWKRAMGLGREKSESLDKARLLFPMSELHLKKHSGRAEALLIAHWAYRNQPESKAA